MVAGHATTVSADDWEHLAFSIPNCLATLPLAVSAVAATGAAFVDLRAGDFRRVAATAQLETVGFEALLAFIHTPSLAIRAVALGGARATACVALASVTEIILGHAGALVPGGSLGYIGA